MENDDAGICYIWSERSANGPWTYSDDTIRWRVDSPRAGGIYCVNADLIGVKELRRLDERVKARLTTLLVDMRNQNDEKYAPYVSKELIERAQRARPLNVDERAERLLRFIATQLKSISDTVTLECLDRSPTDASMRAMAWSESTSGNEVQYLLDYLQHDQQRWIQGLPRLFDYRVTVDGYRKLAEIRTNLDSGQAFVAMWFGDETNDAYEQGIKPAIRAAGFTPMRIDQKQDVVKIDDAIIAEIRRSRFLVADFTHGKNGASGGVYFEAGFAFGLNIPVIYLCRNDSIDKIHFDTRQYHHITWSSPERLRTDLKNRILALIGEGPERRSP